MIKKGDTIFQLRLPKMIIVRYFYFTLRRKEIKIGSDLLSFILSDKNKETVKTDIYQI